MTHSNIQTIEQSCIAIQAACGQVLSDTEAVRDSVHAISIGTVTTVDNLLDDTHGQATAAYNGTTSKLDMGIPAGDKGDAATLDVGSTTNLAPGSTATVVNSGTTSDAVFDFGIPEGLTGSTGSPGATGAAYAFDVEDTLVNKSTYDTEVKGFSFFAIDEGKAYWKLSSVDGDWGPGVPFASAEYIVNSQRYGRNILINGTIASGTRTVNQRNFDGDLTAIAEDEYCYDMWFKTGNKITQRVQKGNYEPSTIYIATRRIYEDEVLISKVETILTSPLESEWNWDIDFEYADYHYDAGTYKYVTMQVEKGKLSSDFEMKTHAETLLKCEYYYMEIGNEFLLPKTNDLDIERKLVMQLRTRINAQPMAGRITQTLTNCTLVSSSTAVGGVLEIIVTPTDGTLDVGISNIKLDGSI